jgi:tRNA nucleotidyltransferase/poly(A) polymerase
MSPLLVQEVEDDSSPTGILELTPVETTFKRLLLDVAEYIDNNPTSSSSETAAKLPKELEDENIVLRFTGGWVRDKLLGIGSHDIDVAINKMTGYQFGLRLKEYLEIPGNAEKYGLEGVATTDKANQKAGMSDKSKTVGGLHKIEANPEKSKHLETVTTKILGLDIDLVNLRKETYTDDSRNPQMEFGTPEEDALRRDATVNAMFYNLNTSRVEDFTGLGMSDLQEKIMRTPLEPYQTFKDDPLRVLRLIRFASRLSYTIESSAQDAVRNPEIKDSLRRKISRERVGIEVEKMLKGPDPHEALRMIFQLDLYETIFSDPLVESGGHYSPDTAEWQSVIDFLRDAVDNSTPAADILIRDNEEQFLAWQLAALVPYRDAPQPEPSEPGKKPPPPIAAQVAREGIKATNKVCDVVSLAVKDQSEISGLVDRFNLQKRRPDKKVEGEDATARDVLGMAIRRWGPSWRSQVVYSMLVEIANEVNAPEGELSRNLECFATLLTKFVAIERRYTSFLQHIRDLGVLDAYSFKPLMDGKALAKALNTAPGPWMKDALDVVMAYQLKYPGKANAADAIAEVQASRHQNGNGNGGELSSALVRHFLTLTIRPLFAKARPTTVTDAGRKNTATVLPKKMTTENMDDSVTKPWKGEREAYALDLLRWCVKALDGRTVEEVWPQIIPPLLTLVDDWEANYKTLGVELVNQLLEVTPPSLLERTGLGEVFEEALMPCLTFLPDVTPESDSIPLLDATYPTLLTLAATRYPQKPLSTSKHNSADLARVRVKFLDTIIRKGVIYGYTYCSNYPRIISTLFKHLAPILDSLGIESVKHLQYLLPILTETLSHPLAEAQIDTLISAAKALRALILNGWPRMVRYRSEVLKGLTLAWLSIKSVQGGEVEVLRSEMRDTVTVLKYAVKREVDFDAELELLVEADPGVKGLLTES